MSKSIMDAYREDRQIAESADRRMSEVNAKAAEMTAEQRAESDAARQRGVDAAKIRETRASSDKRSDDTAMRFLRVVGHHNLMLPMCPHASTVRGGTCPACGGAVLTADERRTVPKRSN